MSLVLKTTLAFLLATQLIPATAADEASGDPQPAKFCKTGTLQAGLEDRYKVLDKKIPIAKVVQPADTLLQVTVQHQLIRQSVEASSDIFFKDKSPLNKDLTMRAGDRAEIIKTIFGPNGEKYFMFALEGRMAPNYYLVKPDGMLCGQKLKLYDGIVQETGLPMTFQSSPMKFLPPEERLADFKEFLITVKLVELLGPNAVIEASYYAQGQLRARKEFTVDIQKNNGERGNVSIQEMRFELRKSGEGAKLSWVGEPDSYDAWARKVFFVPGA